MWRSDRVTTGILAVLLLASGTLGAVGVGATQAGVFISDLTTTPAEPTVGEEVTFQVQVNNPTVGEFDVDSLTLKTADGTRTLEVKQSDESIPSDEEGTVTISRVFSEPGEYELTVVVQGEVRGIPVTREQTITVDVDTVARPSVAVVGDDTTVGEETTVSVVLSNARDDGLQDVTVQVAGENVRTNRSRYVLPSVEAGTSREFEFGVTPTTAGDKTVTAVVEYVTPGGERQRVVRNLTVGVEEATSDVVVSAETGSGAQPPVVATVTNRGNVRAEEPTVEVVSNGTVVARTFLSDLAPGESRTVRLNVSNTSARFTVRASYTAADRQQTSQVRLDYQSNPATIRLTGVESSREDGLVTLSGSASNLGMAPAGSVLVEVLSDEGVQPAGPNPEFFVGRVGASDFVSFELTAEVDDGTEEVPLRVTWIDDGTRRSATVSVAIGANTTPVAPQPSSGGNTPLLIGVSVIGLGVIVVMGYGLYNSLQ